MKCWFTHSGLIGKAVNRKTINRFGMIVAEREREREREKKNAREYTAKFGENNNFYLFFREK
jgi:hypothetical protein